MTEKPKNARLSYDDIFEEFSRRSVSADDLYVRNTADDRLATRTDIDRRYAALLESFYSRPQMGTRTTKDSLRQAPRA